MAETKGVNKYEIHEAARDGRLQVVESLLQTNPKLAKRVDEDERTAMHWATAHNQLEVVKLLTAQKSFDPDVQDGSGWTALTIASSLKDDGGMSVIELLLNKEADPSITTTTGATALHLATSKNNLEVVRRLLGAGTSARVKDRRGQLALHRAAAVGNVPLVKLLLGPEGKSPLNAADVDGMTALHHAVCEGHAHVALELLKAGAESDKKDVDGRSAIDLAPDAKVRNFILVEAERAGIDLST